MKQTIEELILGNSAIINYYQEARRLWEDIWANPQSSEVDGLANLLTDNQLTFEHHCGGRHLGQEVMVASGFAFLYSTREGFAGDDYERIRRLNVAFQRSHCSVEVISEARRIAAQYIE